MPLAAWALLPVSKLYGAAVERRFLKAKPYRSSLPVICVGNFTKGGAGKTPSALKLASLLAAAGRKPAFLSRGFGGSEIGPYRVDPARDTAERVGDEPLLLARLAPTVVSRDRCAGARTIEALDADVIVMDDGFQNPSLAKTFNIVVVDGAVGVGNGRVFPLGPLRAPLTEQVRRADAILILGCEGKFAHARELGESLTAAGARCEFFHAELAPISRGDMAGVPVIAFCGIGRPAKFFATVERRGYSLLETRAFPDHHVYSQKDASELLARAKSARARLLTTEKDATRLRNKTGAIAELGRAAEVLAVEVAFEEGDETRLLALLGTKLRAL
jgi:tetraacyldisaccharide 4'-kinase